MPPKIQTPINNKLLSAMGAVGEYIYPLEPDILGEFFVLETISNSGFEMEDTLDFVLGAFALGGGHAAVFFFRVFFYYLRF